MKIQGLSQLLVFLGLAFLHGFSFAQEDSEFAPYEVIETLTVEMLQLVEDHRLSLDQEPQSFYDAVNNALSQVVAFDFIANGVMGRYASQASPEQRRFFSEVFSSDLINTYAKGMAAFGDADIEVIRPEVGVGDKDRVAVFQKVATSNGEASVSYTMGKSSQTGEWKILNVVINGINLGSTFRSQFAQSMQSEGDVERVIEGWSSQNLSVSAL